MIFLFLFSIVSTSGCLEDEVSNSSNNDESNNDNYYDYNDNSSNQDTGASNLDSDNDGVDNDPAPEQTPCFRSFRNLSRESDFRVVEHVKNQSFFDTSMRSVAFNVISILTGTGYVTQNFSDWGQFPLIYFLILMFIGGCAGSTACGIKIFRVQILFQFVSVQLKKIIYPRGIFKIKYENNNIDEKFLESIISFIFLYIVIFFVKTALLSTSGLDLTTSISAAATSISNVGPGLGDIIGPNGNFSNLSDFS